MIAELESAGPATGDLLLEGAGGVMHLLRQQASMYTRLEEFSRRQRTLVAEEDTRPLLGLLADRQKLSLELAMVSRRLEPVREHWPRYRETMTADDRAEARALLDEMRACLARVIENDEQDARVLRVRKQMVGAALAESQSRSSAVVAYRATAAANGRRVDEEQ